MRSTIALMLALAATYASAENLLDLELDDDLEERRILEAEEHQDRRLQRGNCKEWIDNVD